jgi:hypothetical protein
VVDASPSSDYDKALELDPNSFRAYNGRGQVRAEMDEFQKAVVDLDRAEFYSTKK